jgi:hypothetical protein
MHSNVNTYLLLLSLSGLGIATDRQQPLQAASKHDSWFDLDFDKLAESTLHQWHVPGLSIAVIDNGKISSKVAHSFVLPILLYPFSTQC